MSFRSKVIALTDRQTHTHTHTHTLSIDYLLSRTSKVVGVVGKD